MGVKITNNAVSTIVGAISSSDAGIAVVGGTGVLFPVLGSGDYFYATLTDTAGTREIVKVTARASDAMTIVRAQEGTSAQSFAAGSRIELRVTAASVADLIADQVALKDQASEIGFTPAGSISATNVQAAIVELDSEAAKSAALAATGGSALVGFIQSGAGATARTAQSKMRETLSVLDFGAVGDGVADDTAAIQAALNYAAPLGATVFFPPGTYRTTATVGFTRSGTERFGVRVVGSGEFYTSILADHNAGPVLALNRSYGLVQDITLTASATRTAGAAGTTNPNCGLLMEAPDTSTAAVARMTVNRVRVLSQPSHGIVHVGLMIESYYEQALCQSNLGHGFVFDGGQMTSRTNQNYPGLVTLMNCWALSNAGHGLKIGDPNDAAIAQPLRFAMINFECAGNAASAGVRLTADEIWLRGLNMVFDTCAIGTLAAPTTGCIRFAGENLQVRNHRSVNTTSTLRLELDTLSGGGGLSTTRGIVIDGLRVLNNAQNPAIIVSDLVNVRDITANTYGGDDNITRMFTTGALGAVWNLRPPVSSAVTTVNQTVNNSTTLVDVTELAVYLRASRSAYFEASIRHSGDATADIKIAFTAPAGATVRWDNTNSGYVAAGDAWTISNAEIIEGGIRAFGASAIGTRSIDIRGWVVMGSTAGALQMQFAQNTATAVNTTILAGSTLRVFGANTNV